MFMCDQRWSSCCLHIVGRQAYCYDKYVVNDWCMQHIVVNKVVSWTTDAYGGFLVYGTKVRVSNAAAIHLPAYSREWLPSLLVRYFPFGSAKTIQQYNQVVCFTTREYTSTTVVVMMLLFSRSYSSSSHRHDLFTGRHSILNPRCTQKPIYTPVIVLGHKTGSNTW